MKTRSKLKFHPQPVLLVIAMVLASLLAACSGAKPPSEPAGKQYHLTGIVQGLDAKVHTATVKADAVPGWMEAMTMDFPIRSKSDFEQLHVGDHITATVNVRGADYDVTNIRRQNTKP